MRKGQKFHYLRHLLLGSQITFGEVVPDGVAWQVKSSGVLSVIEPADGSVGTSKIKASEIVGIRSALNALEKPGTATNQNVPVFNSSRELVDSGYNIRNVVPHSSESSLIDCNTITTPGWFNGLIRGGSGYAPNSPPTPAGAYWFIEVHAHEGTVFTQYAWPYGSSLQSFPTMRPMIRSTNTAGTWNSWAELSPSSVPEGVYTRTNILGAVSQSSGVPTGAIIEAGSNANGEYVKFADGTQICILISRATGPLTATYGPIFSSAQLGPFSLPASFVTVPSAFTSSASEVVWFGTLAAASVVYVRAFTGVTNSASYNYRVTLIGRWY